ncbi:hypothetical protein CASFOL_008964 [Castilleja foliolosa]|uniref:glutathione transferase n=1 Tax=Castilleja foliolosa TaxID=1961234 RepID=A0ABD3E4K4_9LAMI
MAIKLHGNPLSPAAQRVFLALAEKELEYELVFVDFATGQHKKEPFISINPFGQVPAFEDGDLKLFESRAITKYISYAYAEGTPLLVHDPKKLAIIGVWLEVEAHRFDAAGNKLSFEILIKPLMGLTTDEAQVEELEAQLGTVLDIYEKRLAESKYLGGEEYSLVDLHHVPIVNNLMKTKVKALFEKRPHVSAWAESILARPAWQKVLDDIKL